MNLMFIRLMEVSTQKRMEKFSVLFPFDTAISWKNIGLFLVIIFHNINKEIDHSNSFKVVHNWYVCSFVLSFIFKSRWWCSGLERSPRMLKVGCSNPSHDIPKSKKQLVTAPLLNARQQVWVSRVLGDDHYKRMSRVTVGLARLRTLTARCPWMPSIGQNLQPFTGNGDEWTIL